MTRDPEGSQFYGEMFGWTTDEMQVGPVTYTFFNLGERPVGGMIGITDEMQMKDAPPHWLNYITVEDVAASVERAKALGATVCKDVTELPMGKFAVLIDPQGAVIALWEFGEGSC
ncbi:MAG: VOC family protein [Verrucomicrobiales bacterium]